MNETMVTNQNILFLHISMNHRPYLNKMAAKKIIKIAIFWFFGKYVLSFAGSYKWPLTNESDIQFGPPWPFVFANEQVALGRRGVRWNEGWEWIIIMDPSWGQSRYAPGSRKLVGIKKRSWKLKLNKFGS